MAAPVSQVDVVPFVPKPRFTIDWGLVSVGVGALLGLVLGGAGALTLAGQLSAVGPVTLRPTHGVDLLAIGYLVLTGPIALRQWRERRRLERIDARLPDFLTDLASLHKAGLTLQDSVLTAAQGDYGDLTKDVRMAADHVRWNVPILTVLANLKDRIDTPIAQRTMTVVLEAGHSGGNVPEVLEIAAGNARAFVQLRDERKRSMGLYTIITYVASLVFVMVALALQGIFVPKMIGAFGQAAGGGSALGFKQLPTADEFRNLFYASALVQSIGNGLVGGVMSDGRALSGLRHAWFMVLLCVVGFALAG